MLKNAVCIVESDFKKVTLAKNLPFAKKSTIFTQSHETLWKQLPHYVISQYKPLIINAHSCILFMQKYVENHTLQFHNFQMPGK